MTEFAPASPSMDQPPEAFPPSPRTRTGAPRQSSTLGRSAGRHVRASTLVFEPGTKAEGGEDDGSAGQAREADAFRARIEALRADMGEGWLKVFTQSHMGSPPPAARTPAPVSPSSRS